MRAKRKKRADSGLNVIPLVDIVFQLILFFIVATTFAVIPAVSVNLPKSGTKASAEVGAIVIEAFEGGDVLFNGKKIRVQSISNALSEFDSAPVTLVCDRNVTSGEILRIFDELREAGFVEIDLRTAGE